MALDPVDQKIIDDIAQYGWSSMSVAPRHDSDDPEERWTYTIGLQQTYGWPELVIFGVDSSTAHGLLSDAIAECLERKLAPEDGVLLKETIQGLTAKLANGCDIPDHYFGCALWFNRYAKIESELKTLQLLWPDRAGRLPGELNCDEGVRVAQQPLEAN